MEFEMDGLITLQHPENELNKIYPFVFMVNERKMFPKYWNSKLIGIVAKLSSPLGNRVYDESGLLAIWEVAPMVNWIDCVVLRGLGRIFVAGRYL